MQSNNNRLDAKLICKFSLYYNTANALLIRKSFLFNGLSINLAIKPKTITNTNHKVELKLMF